MSRYKFNASGKDYIVVGWDRPFQSFFYQVFNGADKERLDELEGKKNKTPDEAKELEALYDKYDATGGEPITLEGGADGFNYINTVADLNKMLPCTIPENIMKTLELEQKEQGPEDTPVMRKLKEMGFPFK